MAEAGLEIALMAIERLDAIDDHSEDADTATPLSIGTSIVGSIETAGDRDWFRVQLTAGVTYVITERGSTGNFGTLGDPFLSLYDRLGVLVAVNDDSGATPNSRIEYTPTASDTYYVEAGAYDAFQTGTYTVGIQRLSGPAQGSSTPDQPTQDPGVSNAFRFFDTRDGGHFFTTSVLERDQVLATRPDLRAEGVAFQALTTAAQGGSPVFRFFDTRDGGHFFTISAQERDQVLATRPDLRFEGVAFYEYATSQGSSSEAVYRFFDRQDGGHFFTSSLVERNQVMATRPDLAYEGIAFYAPDLV